MNITPTFGANVFRILIYISRSSAGIPTKNRTNSPREILFASSFRNGGVKENRNQGRRLGSNRTTGQLVCYPQWGQSPRGWC